MQREQQSINGVDTNVSLPKHNNITNAIEEFLEEGNSEEYASDMDVDTDVWLLSFALKTYFQVHENLLFSNTHSGIFVMI